MLQHWCPRGRVTTTLRARPLTGVDVVQPVCRGVVAHCGSLPSTGDGCPARTRDRVQSSGSGFGEAAANGRTAAPRCARSVIGPITAGAQCSVPSRAPSLRPVPTQSSARLHALQRFSTPATQVLGLPAAGVGALRSVGHARSQPRITAVPPGQQLGLPEEAGRTGHVLIAGGTGQFGVALRGAHEHRNACICVELEPGRAIVEADRTRNHAGMPANAMQQAEGTLRCRPARGAVRGLAPLVRRPLPLSKDAADRGLRIAIRQEGGEQQQDRKQCSLVHGRQPRTRACPAACAVRERHAGTARDSRPIHRHARSRTRRLEASRVLHHQSTAVM